MQVLERVGDSEDQTKLYCPTARPSRSYSPNESDSKGRRMNRKTHRSTHAPPSRGPMICLGRRSGERAEPEKTRLLCHPARTPTLPSWQGFGRGQETGASTQEKLPYGRNYRPENRAFVGSLSIKTLCRAKRGYPSEQPLVGSPRSVAPCDHVRRHVRRDSPLLPPAAP